MRQTGRKNKVPRAQHNLRTTNQIITLTLGAALLASCASSITIGPQGVTTLDSLPSPELRPTFGSAEVTSESPPIIARIIAGGIIDARRTVSEECTGHIAREPDCTVSLVDEVGDITFTGRAYAGLSLVISDPNGNLTYSTNLGRPDARTSIARPSRGRYAVWLGVDPRGNTVDAELRVEIGSVTE